MDIRFDNTIHLLLAIHSNTDLPKIYSSIYIITVPNGKLPSIWLSKKTFTDLNLILVMFNQFKDFSINLNAQHVNGMTPFD